MPDAALVAGGTGALGGAVVEELLDSGWEVWVCDREDRGATEGARFVQADLTDPAAAESAVSTVEGLRAVVNLVGGFASGPRLHETSLDDFMRMLTLNLVPGYTLARAAMPRLIDAGGGA